MIHRADGCIIYILQFTVVQRELTVMRSTASANLCSNNSHRKEFVLCSLLYSRSSRRMLSDDSDDDDGDSDDDDYNDDGGAAE